MGQLVRLLEVLGGQQDGRAVPDQRADHVPLLPTAPWIEPGRRLVEKEHRWQQNERRRQVEAPSHATRVGFRNSVGGVHQVELAEQLLGAALCVVPRNVIQLPDHLQVFASGQVFVDRDRLAGQADLGLDPVGVFDDVEAGDGGATGVGFEQGRQDTHRGRLARTVGPEQREERTLVDVEVQPVQRADAPVTLDQSLGGNGVIDGHP